MDIASLPPWPLSDALSSSLRYSASGNAADCMMGSLPISAELSFTPTDAQAASDASELTRAVTLQTPAPLLCCSQALSAVCLSSWLARNSGCLRSVLLGSGLGERPQAAACWRLSFLRFERALSLAAIAAICSFCSLLPHNLGCRECRIMDIQHVTGGLAQWGSLSVYPLVPVCLKKTRTVTDCNGNNATWTTQQHAKTKVSMSTRQTWQHLINTLVYR